MDEQRKCVVVIVGFGRGYHCVSWVLCDRGVGVLVCSVVVGSVGVGVLLVAVGLVCYGYLLFTISCSMDSSLSRLVLQ